MKFKNKKLTIIGIIIFILLISGIGLNNYKTTQDNYEIIQDLGYGMNHIVNYRYKPLLGSLGAEMIVIEFQREAYEEYFYDYLGDYDEELESYSNAKSTYLTVDEEKYLELTNSQDALLNKFETLTNDKSFKRFFNKNKKNKEILHTLTNIKEVFETLDDTLKDKEYHSQDDLNVLRYTIDNFNAYYEDFKNAFK